jgi:tetratricopeptide (TPR) repeat protein
LEQIGEGGFGVVFMAEQQEPIRRKVALKVLKPGMDTRQVVVRFEAERQALALMDHPHIAHVFDGGETATGRPYFVMELVRGIPITDFCDQNCLSIRERLELFVNVCQAVQHAHQKGIIHRDIKPSNVMVTLHDGTPVVKVIDFGIAKATGQQLTDKTLFTHFAQMIGTPLYMSPEQAGMSGLDVDTRSDIYSLGVLLYELLTGTTPFDRGRLREADYDEVRRIIREEEPARPSTRISTLGQAAATISTQRQSEPKRLSQLFRGELDWIVMKALEKDRNRRYETSSALAADVQCYLHDEVVAARPPSLGYRLRKAARRHRLGLAVAGLILFFIALLAGGGGWVISDRTGRQAKAVKELELALDRAKLFHGEKKRAEALAALDRADLLAGQLPADPARDERLAALKERLTAEARDEEFVARFEDIRLRVQSQLNARTGVFNPKAAYPEIRDALHQFGITIGTMPPSEVASCVQGRPDAVRRSLVGALDECLRWAPLDDAPLGKWLLAALAAADNDSWRVQARKAAAEGDWNGLERLAREADVAKQPVNFLLFVAGSLPPQMREARLELAQRIQRAFPEDLFANHRLGYELVYSGRPAEAIRYFTAALALRPANPGMLVNRGESLRMAGEVDAAIVDFRRVLAIDPQQPLALCALASALQAKSQLDEAIAEYREAIRLTKDLPTARGLHAEARNGLGAVLADKGRLDEAIAEFRAAIELKKDDPKIHNNLGIALRFKGQLVESLAPLTRAIELDPKYVSAWGNRGYVYRKLGRYAEAITDYQTALKLQPANAWTCNALAQLLATCPEAKLREPALAIEMAKRAVRLASQDGNSWLSLGVAQYRAGKYETAIVALDMCLTVTPGADAAPWFFLAMAHGKLGHRDEARKFYGQGVAWMEKYKSRLDKDIVEDMRGFRNEAEIVLDRMKKEP